MKRTIMAVALAALLAAFHAHAQTVPTSREQIQFSYAPVVKKAAPAVVNVFARKVIQNRQPAMFDDPIFRHFFGEGIGRGMPRERIEKSLGSGVIVRNSGLVVTNNHVIEGASDIRVVLADRREFDATLAASDERSDLAVLRISAPEKLPFLDLRDSDEIEVGDMVLAIGNPFGVGQTVTSGIVSALARTTVGAADYRYFIQTDAAINPGNSGGALVGMDGKLVGINSAIYSKSGGSQGIGFAIPANMVAAFVRGVENGGKITRPWFGASGQDVTAEAAPALGLSHPTGVLVTEVYPGGPAERGGLKAGDLVLTIDGHEINDPQGLRFRIATRAVGGTAALKLLRRGQEHTISIPLEQPPEQPPREVTDIGGRLLLSGATLANLNPALAEETGAEAMARGVIVLRVVAGSLANRIGVQPGDFVLAINNSEVATVAALMKLLQQPARSWILTLQRGPQVLNVQVGG